MVETASRLFAALCERLVTEEGADALRTLADHVAGVAQSAALPRAHLNCPSVHGAQIVAQDECEPLPGRESCDLRQLAQQASPKRWRSFSANSELQRRRLQTPTRNPSSAGRLARWRRRRAKA